MGGFTKSKVYANERQNLTGFKEEKAGKMAEVVPKLCERVIKNFD